MIIVTNKNTKKFIRGLQKHTRSKIFRNIELLEKFGTKLSMPYAKKIRRHLYELRVRGKQEIRIFYTFKDNKILLLHGFVKKTNKIPIREIKTALNRLKAIDV